MKIVIATGIYPPEIGGPAQYSKNLADVWKSKGYKVSVKVFSRWNFLPTGIRHSIYFLSLIPQIVSADFILALDTFSSALPAVFAAKIFDKKVFIRTGGDFLWESYVERTGKKVLFRNFYKTEIPNLSYKERRIFKLTKWVLENASKIVFSTEWQKDIFTQAYNLDLQKTIVIENYYSPQDSWGFDSVSKTFVASSRKLKWKNLETLENIFSSPELKNLDLFTETVEYSRFIEKIKNSYAVILLSLGDISPNIIMDAIKCGKPFICTKEIGIMNRIGNFGVFVDPLSKEEVKNAVLKLLIPEEYEKAKEKVSRFSFVHSWEEIAKEYIDVYNKIK